MNKLAAQIEQMTSDQFYQFVTALCKAYLDPVHAAGACYCWECKNNPGLKTRTKGMLWCRQWRKEVKPDDFCSSGEPKEAGE